MRCLSLFLAALSVIACEGPIGPRGDPGETVPPGTMWGTYDLASVNGKLLPYTQASGNTSTVIAGGSVSLNQNGSFVRSTTYYFISGSVTTSDVIILAGHYSDSEGTLTLTNGQITIPATVFRNTLTLNPVGAETYVYRR